MLTASVSVAMKERNLVKQVFEITVALLASDHVSAANTLTLLMEMPATVIVYREHRRTAGDYLPDHHVHRNYYETRNRKHRRDAAKPAACAKPLMLSTLGARERGEGG